jgi:hypothetical protein
MKVYPLLAALLTWACGPSIQIQRVDLTARPARAADAVTVLTEKPVRAFKAIAVLRASESDLLFGSPEKMIRTLAGDAGKLGAEAILLVQDGLETQGYISNRYMTVPSNAYVVYAVALIWLDGPSEPNTTARDFLKPKW